MTWIAAKRSRDVVLVALALGLAAHAGAHSRSESYSYWQVEKRATGERQVSATVNLKVSVALQMPWEADRDWRDQATRHMVEKLSVGPDCRLEEMPLAFFAERIGMVRVNFSWLCPAEGELLVRQDAFFDMVPTHTHILRRSVEGVELPEKLMTASAREFRLTEVGKGSARVAGGLGSSLRAYFLLGVEHILSGYDHLAFLLALLLLVSNWRQVLLVVTGFTLGHSLTLALGVLGWVRANGDWVEALIGFSIFLLAAEAMSRISGHLPHYRRALSLGLLVMLALAVAGLSGSEAIGILALLLFSYCYLSLVERNLHRAQAVVFPVTLLFGLVHGFGFAGSLSEVGLPRERLVQALLGFNLGVEAGQLLFVAVAGGGWSLVRRLLAPLRTDGDLLKAVTLSTLAGLGLFWFVSRTYS